LRYSNYVNAAAAVSDTKQLYLSNCKNPDPSYATSYTPYVTNLLGTGGGGAAGTGIYNKYVVMQARVRMFYSNTNSSRYVQMVCLATNDSSSSSLLPITAVGREWSSPMQLVGTAGSAKGNTLITMDFPLHKVFGVPLSALRDDDDYHGTPSAAPSEQIYFYCYLFSLDGATNLTGTFSYTIEFDVEFFDKQLEEE